MQFPVRRLVFYPLPNSTSLALRLVSINPRKSFPGGITGSRGGLVMSKSNPYFAWKRTQRVGVRARRSQRRPPNSMSTVMGSASAHFVLVRFIRCSGGRLQRRRRSVGSDDWDGGILFVPFVGY